MPGLDVLPSNDLQSLPVLWRGALGQEPEMRASADRVPTSVGDGVERNINLGDVDTPFFPERVLVRMSFAEVWPVNPASNEILLFAHCLAYLLRREALPRLGHAKRPDNLDADGKWSNLTGLGEGQRLVVVRPDHNILGVAMRLEEGEILYEEHIERGLTGNLVGATVTVLEGNLFGDLKRLNEQAKVAKVKALCPLESTPIGLCIGLNYKEHVKGANLSIVPYPVVFTKPPTALVGPYDDVHIHPDAKLMLDYEGERVVIISKDSKNISEQEALDYVLGYNMATAAIPNPRALRYMTRVNREKRQETLINGMIWNVRQIIAYLTRGTTLLKGTLIMTGTPRVGLFLDPEGFVKHNDNVEIEFVGFGSRKTGWYLTREAELASW
ncbi:hypothetical protein NM208_g9988 [Fusarium decemcellulare]|uniref:Uncharacterized protein n=1 Tax=Fusarium decemcellulare TaxID=57161 RepID=A0ACC1RZI1_9HYPO|nr:hypothetical protein NM208_g9988 [Fusarium decemcellulare]